MKKSANNKSGSGSLTDHHKSKQQQVDDWNAKYPPGTPVKVRLDNGESLFDGIAVCYMLSRVSPIWETL
jgi:hypothetical protein